MTCPNPKLTFFNFLLIGLLAYTSCRKTDRPVLEQFANTSVENRFFNMHRSADPTEKAFVEFLKRKNNTLHFIEKTISRIGFPRWDKMIVRTKAKTNGRNGTSDTTATRIYIPFVRDSEDYVNASMVIKITPSDTTFTYLCDWQYKSKPHGPLTVDSSAERYAVFFMLLDNFTLGHKKFTLIDGSLFLPSSTHSDSVRTLSFLNVTNPFSTKASLYYYQEICLDFYVCATPDWCAQHGGCDYLNCLAPVDDPYHCYLQQSYCDGWWEDDGSGGGGGGSDPGGDPGSGGGGGNDDGTPPECSGRTVQRNAPLPGCEPGWDPEPIEDDTPENPCLTAQSGAQAATNLSKEQIYLNAKSQIQNADPAIEHAIGFGKDAAGNLTTSSMVNGSGTNGTVPPIPGGFADIHNHPNNKEPSAGDLYSLIQKNTPTNGYNTRFVITGGTVYAFVVTNPQLADRFASVHPPVVATNPQTGQPYPPEFPDDANGNVFLDYDNSRLYFENTLGYNKLLADAMGKAFVLEKYNAGVAILKQEANGTFKILRVKQTSTTGLTGTFEDISCN